MKECNQCGKCCIHYGDGGLSATPKEIESWELFRPDIALYVRDGEIWVEPGTGVPLKRCPWLKLLAPDNHSPDVEKYGCSIYQDRPDDCRQYPVNIADMHRDNCEMLELRDLDFPRQSQRTLDKLMQRI